MFKDIYIRAVFVLGLVFAFLVNTIGPLPLAYAQEGFLLPPPGQMVELSPTFSPAVLKGIKLDPQNPFRFHFFVDSGDTKLKQEELKYESSKLIKYFLASLTIPEKDLWVNLSPYEKDRIVPEEFGQTEMGRDLLAEDYMLKQITASLIYPEDKIGKEFWQKVYAQAQAKYGTTNIPINTFNKVWILPDKAVVYENGGTAFVLENHLKVMLEEDYLALQKHSNSGFPTKTFGNDNGKIHSIASSIIRQIVLPDLEKEVNEGKNFSRLRQVFYSLILATWYKQKIKDSILNKIYSNRYKIGGVNISPGDKDKIYQEYLKAFKKGVFNYIKEDSNPLITQPIPRKYFSGGVDALNVDHAMNVITRPQMTAEETDDVRGARVIEELVDIGVTYRSNGKYSKEKLNKYLLSQGNPPEMIRKFFEFIESKEKRKSELILSVGSGEAGAEVAIAAGHKDTKMIVTDAYDPFSLDTRYANYGKRFQIGKLGVQLYANKPNSNLCVLRTNGLVLINLLPKQSLDSLLVLRPEEEVFDALMDKLNIKTLFEKLRLNGGVYIIPAYLSHLEQIKSLRAPYIVNVIPREIIKGVDLSRYGQFTKDGLGLFFIKDAAMNAINRNELNTLSETDIRRAKEIAEKMKTLPSEVGLVWGDILSNISFKLTELARHPSEDVLIRLRNIGLNINEMDQLISQLGTIDTSKEKRKDVLLKNLEKVINGELKFEKPSGRILYLWDLLDNENILNQWDEVRKAYQEIRPLLVAMVGRYVNIEEINPLMQPSKEVMFAIVQLKYWYTLRENNEATSSLNGVFIHPLNELYGKVSTFYQRYRTEGLSAMDSKEYLAMNNAFEEALAFIHPMIDLDADQIRTMNISAQERLGFVTKREFEKENIGHIYDAILLDLVKAGYVSNGHQVNLKLYQLTDDFKKAHTGKYSPEEFKKVDIILERLSLASLDRKEIAINVKIAETGKIVDPLERSEAKERLAIDKKLLWKNNHMLKFISHEDWFDVSLSRRLGEFYQNLTRLHEKWKEAVNPLMREKGLSVEDVNQQDKRPSVKDVRMLLIDHKQTWVSPDNLLVQSNGFSMPSFKEFKDLLKSSSRNVQFQSMPLEQFIKTVQYYAEENMIRVSGYYPAETRLTAVQYLVDTTYFEESKSGLLHDIELEILWRAGIKPDQAQSAQMNENKRNETIILERPIHLKHGQHTSVILMGEQVKHLSIYAESQTAGSGLAWDLTVFRDAIGNLYMRGDDNQDILIEHNKKYSYGEGSNQFSISSFGSSLLIQSDGSGLQVFVGVPFVLGKTIITKSQKTIGIGSESFIFEKDRHGVLTISSPFIKTIRVEPQASFELSLPGGWWIAGGINNEDEVIINNFTSNRLIGAVWGDQIKFKLIRQETVKSPPLIIEKTLAMDEQTGAIPVKDDQTINVIIGFKSHVYRFTGYKKYGKIHLNKQYAENEGIPRGFSWLHEEDGELMLGMTLSNYLAIDSLSSENVNVRVIIQDSKTMDSKGEIENSFRAALEHGDLRKARQILQTFKETAVGVALDVLFPYYNEILNTEEYFFKELLISQWQATFNRYIENVDLTKAGILLANVEELIGKEEGKQEILLDARLSLAKARILLVAQQQLEHNFKKFKAGERISGKKIWERRDRDYYELLALPSDASVEMIKKVYKRLSPKFHPDLIKGELGEEAFKILGEAYDSLTKERDEYDQWYHKRQFHSATSDAAMNGISEDALNTPMNEDAYQFLITNGDFQRSLAKTIVYNLEQQGVSEKGFEWYVNNYTTGDISGRKNNVLEKITYSLSRSNFSGHYRREVGDVLSKMILDLCLSYMKNTKKQTKKPRIKIILNKAPMTNKAMLTPKTTGGIDLNPARMDIQLKKEGQDFKFNFNGTEIDAAQVTGATFTIRQMTPVTNLPELLGLNK